ncbi:hypothetical protein ACFL3G_03165 [Planctomycetota bacterium]
MSNWVIASLIYAGLCVLIDLIFSIGCTVGGWFDLKFLLNALKASEVDETDDGRVD